MKIYYKSPVMWNMVLFCFFSVMFVYFQSLNQLNSSILNKEFYSTFTSQNWGIILLASLTIVSLMKNSKTLASILFMLLIGLTLGKTTYFLFHEFSKLPLVILFFYLLFGFYLFQFYTVEMDESYFNPLYEKNDLFLPVNTEMVTEIFSKDELVCKGTLTNWSEEGCFIYLKEPVSLKGRYDFKVYFKDQVFVDSGKLVSQTKDLHGHGFRFKSIEKRKNIQGLDWRGFYEIIDEMGYKPELLK